jgi:hypothetical protein
MSVETQLTTIIDQMRSNASPPLAVVASGTVTYVIYGAYSVAGITWYPVLRITEPSSSQVYLDKGFLLESLRVSGSNGSTALVNIKTDLVNSLLLLADPLLTYG